MAETEHARSELLDNPESIFRACADMKLLSQEVLRVILLDTRYATSDKSACIPQRYILSWQGRLYEGSGVPLLSGSVEIRSLRGLIVTRAPVDKSSAAALSANRTACSALAGRISSARI